MTTTTSANTKFTSKISKSPSVGEVVEKLKSFNWVDLTHSFGPESPRFPSFARPEFKTIFTHSDGFTSKNILFQGSLELTLIHQFILMNTKISMSKTFLSKN